MVVNDVDIYKFTTAGLHNKFYATTFGKANVTYSQLPAAMIGSEDGEGEGKTRALISVTGCEDREGEGKAPRLIVLLIGCKDREGGETRGLVAVTGCEDGEGEGKVRTLIMPVIGCKVREEEGVTR